MSPTIETGRLTLRPLTLDHVDLLVALDSDPEVMRYITGGPPVSRVETERIVTVSLGYRWLAEESATGEFIGWFAIFPSDAAQEERELGYRLRREAWGRGFATEGSLALIDLAFSELGTRRIWAQTMAANQASRRVMERCGLRYVRTFHFEWDDPIPGTELGEVEYERLAEEDFS